MKRILFVSYGGGHVNTLLPVFERLSKDVRYECLYLALTTAGNVLKEKKIPYIGFKDLVETNDDLALAFGRQLIGTSNKSPAIPYEESVAYMGLSFWDLVQRYGEEEAFRIYNEQGGRQAFNPITPLKRYLKKLQPDLVVATNSPRAEKAAIEVTSQLGIPAVCVVDLFALQEVKWIGKPGFANKICVLSDFVKQMMVDAGRRPEDIVITGNPAFDSMISAKKPDVRKKFRAKKQWRNDEKVILWASNIEPQNHPFSKIEGDPDLPRKIEHRLRALANKEINIRVVFRPHPNDTFVPKDLPNNIEISDSRDDLNELLSAVDCVVVLSSTVGIQAALMNQPLVNINLSIFSKDAPYDAMGLSYGVNDLDELNATILNAMQSKPKAASLAQVGTATNKVVGVINDILDSSKC